MMKYWTKYETLYGDNVQNSPPPNAPNIIIILLLTGEVSPGDTVPRRDSNIFNQFSG